MLLVDKAQETSLTSASSSFIFRMIVKHIGLGIITDILVELFSKNKDKLLMLQLDNNLGILESYQINEITKSIEEQRIIKYLKYLNNRLDIAYRVKEKEVLKTKKDLITKG